MKDKVTIKDKLNCWRNGHPVWNDEWVYHWSDGEEWETNECLRCGKGITRNRFGYSDKVEEKKTPYPPI